MTELEIEGDTFYVLVVKQAKGKKITIHNDMDSPIQKVKDYLKTGTSPEDIDLMTVNIKEEKFEIKSVPWSIIAVGLVKSEA
jgi:uncharacterized protein YjhX (UPF0386 family)